MNQQSICEIQTLVSYDEYGVYDLEEGLASYDTLLASVVGGQADIYANGNGACFNTRNEFCVNTNVCLDNGACVTNAVCVT